MTTLPSCCGADDPCTILRDLEAAYRDLIAGRMPKRVRYRDDSGAEQEVDHQRVDPATLQAEVQRYRTLCAESLGIATGPSQFCITAG